MFNLHHLKPFFKSWKIILGLMILFLLAGCLGGESYAPGYAYPSFEKKTRSSILHCPLFSALCGVHCPFPKTQSHLDRKPNPWAACGFCRRAELPGSPSNRSSCRSGLLLQLSLGAHALCLGSRLGHTLSQGSSLPSGVVPLLKSPQA